MSDRSPRRLVGICGSLRAGSYNAMALRLAQEVVPDGWEMDLLEWRDVPPFDAEHFTQVPVVTSHTGSASVQRAWFSAEHS